MESNLKVTPKQFQENVELWAKWDPPNAIKLQYLDTEGYEFCKTKQNELNLRKGENYYHSQDGALAETKEWFSKIDLAPFKILYIYGIGLAYAYLAAKEWLKSNPKHTLVFMEDDLMVIAKFFETNLARAMLKDKQVRICYFPSVHHTKHPFNILFCKFTTNPFTVQAIPSYSNKETYQELAHRLVYDASQNNAIMEEYLELGILFYRNFYHILLRLPGSYFGNALYEKFSKVPAIICGAGPSLAKQLSLLSTLDTKALIFAGGSAINALTSANIMPHFGAGLDPNPMQYQRYITNKAYELPFFFRTRLNYKAFDVLHGPRLFLTGSGAFSAARYFEEKLELASDNTFEGWNVIHLLIDLAQRLGCDPIILVGMDLGYTNMQSYAPGVIENANVTAEKLESEKNYNDQVLLKKDIYGKPLYTLWKWIAESEWIEDYAKDHENTTLFNATEGGLGFGATPNITFKEAVEKYCTNQQDYHSLVHSEIQNASLSVTKTKIKKEIRNLRKSLKRCIKLITQLIKETKVMKRLIKQEKQVPPSLSTGQAVLFETELAEEDGYNAILVDFNEAYNILLQGEFEKIRYLRSETQQAIKKLQVQEKKYRFLREAARANIMCMDWAMKEYHEVSIQ